MSQESRLVILRDRASMLQKARRFFEERRVTEVDCPILSSRASVDAHIDLIPGILSGHIHCYLHSSPEYGMKRLLSEGMGDIYQLSHVFRDGEIGARHNPEFMMAEWYRVRISFADMIKETTDFISLFLGSQPVEIVSYKDACKRYSKIDPFTINLQELQRRVPDVKSSCLDDYLTTLFAMEVEPHLGKEKLTVIYEYPPSQAALAKINIDRDGIKVAERFEVYFNGVELANGYHELQDAIEQRKRLEDANRLRKMLGKKELPIDENFLTALRKGLPDCCGVAVGVDRLLMLRHKKRELTSILPFVWERA